MRTNTRQPGKRRWRRGTAGAFRSEALVEEAAAPACVLDSQGRVIVANRALEVLLGVGVSGGLRGRTLPALAYPPDEELAHAAAQQVLTAAVQTICHFTRCAMGQVWLPAGDVLVCSPTWFCSGYGFEKLHAASEEVTYEPGQGLPGLAWARRQPLLLEDVRDLGRFDRAFAAQRAGVREALAVPVTGAEGVAAVLELFVTHERAGEPGRLGRIARVAEELGPLVERRRASEALAASQERFQSVTEAAVDAIVSVDGSGRLLTWNGGAERLFGWRSEEIVGRPLTVIIPERFRELHQEGIARVGRSGVEPIEVDLRPLVQAIAEDAGAANPEAELRVGRLPVVIGDPVGFRQLFTNLIENAVRHGGRRDLMVVVEGRECLDGGVELSVSDNGQGIPAEHRERVFGVFERLEGSSTGAGTGMGLAICRKIVEVLGGGIGIEGDHGTDVRIVLPAAVGARWPSHQLTAGSMR